MTNKKTCNYCNYNPQSCNTSKCKKIRYKLCITSEEMTRFNITLAQAVEMVIWAINNSNCNWLAINKKEQLSIINNIDKDFKFWLDRYKYFDRHPQHSQNFYKNKCIKYLEQYNILLGDRLYLFDNSIQMVDVALFPFVRQFAHVNLEWFEITFKNFNLWLNRIKKSELFLSIMLKYDIWDQKGKGIFTDYLSNR